MISCEVFLIPSCMKPEKQSLLSAKSIAKSYELERKTLPIFKDLSIDIYPKDHLTIMGVSGSGKSTLLTILAGLDSPSEGTLWFDGQDITHWDENQLAALRKSDFGFIFQSFHLIPSLSTLENVMFPLQLQGVRVKEAEKKALAMLKRVNMDHRASSFPYQLSGGERQRTAIARALVHNPRIIFADEPTGNLDEKNSDEVLKLLLELKKEFGTALVVVTHENNIAAHSDKIFIMEKGHLRNASTEEVKKIKNH